MSLYMSLKHAVVHISILCRCTSHYTCRCPCHHTCPCTCNGTCCHTFELDNDAFVPLLDLANVFVDVVLGTVAARHFRAVHLQTQHTCRQSIIHHVTCMQHTCTTHAPCMQQTCNLRHQPFNLQSAYTLRRPASMRHAMALHHAVTHTQQATHMHAAAPRRSASPTEPPAARPRCQQQSSSLCCRRTQSPSSWYARSCRTAPAAPVFVHECIRVCVCTNECLCMYINLRCVCTCIRISICAPV